MAQFSFRGKDETVRRPRPRPGVLAAAVAKVERESWKRVKPQLCITMCEQNPTRTHRQAGELTYILQYLA